MGDFERLEREVRMLRRAVLGLATCALALGGVTVASCAHGSAQPPKELTFNDGDRTVTINATGMRVDDGKHHVVLGNGQVTVSDRVQVFAEHAPMTSLEPGVVSVFDEQIGTAKLFLVREVGPELQLVHSPEHNELSAMVGDTFVSVTAKNQTRSVSFAAGKDAAHLALETQDGGGAGLTVRDHSGCLDMGVDGDRPNDRYQVCAPPKK